MQNTNGSGLSKVDQIKAENPIGDFLARLGVQFNGQGLTNQCPITEHTTPGHRPVKIYSDENRWHCHDCGKGGDVIDWFAHKNGITIQEAINQLAGSTSAPAPKQKRKLDQTFDYTDENGALLFQTCRYKPKDFSQRRPDGSGGWIYDLKGVRRVLFKLPELLCDRERVYVTEGEKAANALTFLGVSVTTSAMGAKSAATADWTPLAGREVCILPDNDNDGAAYASDVAETLTNLDPPALVRVVNLPGLPPKGDACDWLRLRNGDAEANLAELENLCAAAKPFATQEMPPDNDTGNARLFIDRYGADLRYVPMLDRWLMWDGNRWHRDEDGGIQRRAMQLSQSLLNDAAGTKDHNQRKAIAERAIKLGNAAKISSMLDLAKCDERVVVHHSKLDSDPWLLGVENGVVDLRTGFFRQGRKSDMVTKSAGCSYDINAKAERWMKFLAEIFAGDAELTAYVQRLVGYSLTGSTSEQTFFFLYGSGANGKSTFIETIAALLNEYGQRAPQSLLVASDNGREPMNEIARLHGARFVVGSETREGDRLAENRIKDLAGGDTLTGRLLYRDAFDFIPALKLWLFGNHQPEIRGTDHGIWRRVRLIPFNVQIAEVNRDYLLLSKLRDELPGILNWAMEGCAAWQRDGLKPPSAVASATAEYREDEDVLRDFLTDETEEDSHGRAYHSDVYNHYTTWCGSKGVRYPINSRKLSKRLRERGLRSERTEHGIRWLGINLACTT